jgi:Predicted transcriptional regulator
VFLLSLYQLCDSEYKFIRIVWDAAPVSSPDLVALCGEKLGWKKSTTYTVLKKLCEKGLLKNDRAMVTVSVPRECVTSAEAENFVDRAFGGSLPGFLSAFMSGRKLTDAEAEDLKRLIDTHREE